MENFLKANHKVILGRIEYVAELYLNQKNSNIRLGGLSISRIRFLQENPGLKMKLHIFFFGNLNI